MKEMSVVQSTAKSAANLTTALLGLGPGGVVIAGLLALAGALTAAYIEIPPFQDAVKDVAKTFQDEGPSAAIEDATSKIDTFLSNLWETWKPKLADFFTTATAFIQEKIGDLFGFEVVPQEQQDWAKAFNVQPPAPPSLDFPGTSFVDPPKPKIFKSFAEGFADAMITEIIPAIGDSINKHKGDLGKELEKLAEAATDWAKDPKNWAGVGLALGSSIGKIVSDLGKPDQVAGGVPRLDGNLNPVLPGAVIVLALDFARSSHGFSDLDRLVELGVHEPNGSTVLADHSPCTDDDRRKCRHRHHAMADRVGDAEDLGASGPLLVRMNGIHVERGQGVVVDGRLSVRLHDRRERMAGLYLRERDWH